MDKDEIEISIRPASDTDLPQLERVAQQQGDHHDTDYFARCLMEQAKGARLLLVAVLSDNSVAAYVQLIWRPIYAPFRALDIPEIQDLAVVPAYRRRGIGEKLVHYCEEQARNAGKSDVGIGVGLHARFGSAQRLYVRLGYVPDGNGVIYDDDTPVNRGDLRPVDDLLTLKLFKKI